MPACKDGADSEECQLDFYSCVMQCKIGKVIILPVSASCCMALQQMQSFISEV